MSGALLASAVVLVLAAAALNGAVTASLRIGAGHLRAMQGEGFRGADALVYVREHSEVVRAAVRVASGALELVAIALVGTTWPEGGLTASGGRIAGTVAVILLLAEILPAAVAARHPVRIALAASPVLMLFGRGAVHIAERVQGIEDAFAGEEEEEEVSGRERELREMWELGRRAGVLEESENLLVERAFRLDELTAWDVMTPRVDMFAWKDSLTLDEIVDSLPRVPYSRVPVYEKTVDDVKGIVYVREAYERLIQGEGSVTLSELAREPFFVPGSLSLSKLLQHFQSRRIHMGIVADEFGGTDGLVTLEDVLEELVGDIVDETDVDEDEIVRVSEDELDADAGVDVREINEIFGIELPSDGHRSLNGFILEELGYVPARGATLEHSGVRIEILEATETQVLRARVTRPAETPKANGEE